MASRSVFLCLKNSILMINANLERFLGTGWFNEATLYLNGFTYWCEGCWDFQKEKPMHFFVYKYPSKIANKIYTKRIDDGKEWEREIVFDILGYGEEDVKVEFLKAKIFDGKSFWEAEDKIAWYDEI